MSEGAALAALWWYIWSLQAALNKDTLWHQILPLFLLSVLLGIRVSYLPFSAGVIYLFYFKWKNKKTSLKHLIGYAGAAIVFQLVWVAALVLSEGGLTGFMKLAMAFTGGHFQSWGGAVTVAGISFMDRIQIFIFQNIFWTGIFSKSPVLAGLYGLLFLLFIIRLKWRDFWKNSLFLLPAILFFSYFLWALLAQNVEKLRHILPLAVLLLYVILVFVLSKWKHSFIIIILIAILGVQLFHSSKLIKEQATNKPATYQMAQYLDARKEQIIIYTWEETRVLDYLNVPFPQKRVETFEVFKQDSGYYSDRVIFLTDKVVRGFQLQGINVNGKVEKAAEFHSNKLFDPVYSDITLYIWKRTGGGGKNE